MGKMTLEDLIDELAQFCDVDEEEKRLAELEAR